MEKKPSPGKKVKNIMNLNINKNNNKKITIQSKNPNFQNISNNLAHLNINKKMINISNNNNYDNILNNGYNVPESSDSSLNALIYEKNILLLNDKIKEQENNIIYLNNRLKNYDITLDKLTKLNIELNKLNEIIRNKNNIIHEFRDIADLSKQEIEKLVKNKKELIQKINILENENRKLKYKNDGNFNYSNIINNGKNSNLNNGKHEDYNKLKLDLNEIIEENKRLKSQINEKDKEIKHLKNEKYDIKYENYKNNSSYNFDYNNCDYMKKKNIIDFKNIYKKNEKYIKDYPNNNLKKINSLIKDVQMQKRSPTPLINNIYNEKYDIYSINNLSKNDYSYRTEPNNELNLVSSHSKRALNFKTKYNYLNKKYNLNPMDYNDYLLHNHQDNFIKNYN